MNLLKKIERGTRPLVATGLCGVVLLGCVPLSAARRQSGAEKPAKLKGLNWMPPNVDAPLRSMASIPPCDVANVLREAGAHALELTTNLENFSAEEQIQYERLDQTAIPEENDSGVFDYVFAFEQNGAGRSSREYRTPTKGGRAFPASGQDTGQVALALIFHPHMQSDYDMNCEGLDKWKGQLAWVIRFQQRKDKPRRTLQFRTEAGSYAAMLTGRAWISMESGQVLHLETNLMQDIPPMDLRRSAISVDYAPVEIQSRKLKLWLPERIEAYWEIGGRRIILYHTFSNFRVFSVDTEQNIEKPKS
ncbi:MAG: hypothetical protein WAK48_00810 [Candidatus Acidiferrum sp.]